MVGSKEDSKHKALENISPISLMESVRFFACGLSPFLEARGTSMQCDRRYTPKPQTQLAAETLSQQEQKQIQQIDFMAAQSRPGKIALEVRVTYLCMSVHSF
jgi:hypothetical protein